MSGRNRTNLLNGLASISTLTGSVIAFAGTVRTEDGSNASPSHGFISDTDTGMYLIGANSLGFAAGGSTIGFFDTGTFTSQQNVVMNTAGKGLFVKQGTNATFGTATLSGNGSVNVSTTVITASSGIYLSPFGVASSAVVAVTTRTVGAGFTVASSSAADTRTFAWFIVGATP